MKILVCAAYTPYPPAGGGRADIWRRIEAFVALGHSVMLLHQYDSDSPIAPTAAHFSEIDQVVTGRCSYPVERGVGSLLRRLLAMRRVPWTVSKALTTGQMRGEADARVREFDPDLVWLDGPWLGEDAQRYAREYGVPLVYRSHNIEHRYLRRQAAASQRLRDRLAWNLATVGLHRYESRLMASADRVLDISLDDLAYWRGQGISNSRWLPPLPELAFSGPPDREVPGEIVFVGGLSLPNNVSGLRWLIGEVLPRVRERHPNVTLSVVGSSARSDLAAELEAHPAVRPYYDVPSVYPHLFGAKVLVNPVSVGSGVQLKMLDMLMTDAPIVSTSQGVRGLPPECTATMSVADDAEAFALAVSDGLAHSADLGADREISRRFFTVQAVGDAIDGLVIEPREMRRGWS